MNELVLTLVRKYKKPNYTIGLLYVGSQFFCNTMEDPDRGLTFNMSPDEIKKKKVYGDTAIPKGRYRIDMNTVSPKYSIISKYAFCGGRMPRLMNVPGFSGILIHPGNTQKDSLGCILPGTNNVKGMVTSSFDTFKKLYDVLNKANREGKTIFIEIK